MTTQSFSKRFAVATLLIAAGCSDNGDNTAPAPAPRNSGASVPTGFQNSAKSPAEVAERLRGMKLALPDFGVTQRANAPRPTARPISRILGAAARNLVPVDESARFDATATSDSVSCDEFFSQLDGAVGKLHGGLVDTVEQVASALKDPAAAKNITQEKAQPNEAFRARIALDRLAIENLLEDLTTSSSLTAVASELGGNVTLTGGANSTAAFLRFSGTLDARTESSSGTLEPWQGDLKIEVFADSAAPELTIAGGITVNGRNENVPMVMSAELRTALRGGTAPAITVAANGKIVADGQQAMAMGFQADMVRKGREIVLDAKLNHDDGQEAKAESLEATIAIDGSGFCSVKRFTCNGKQLCNRMALR